MSNAKRDENRNCVAMGVTDNSSQDTRPLIIDPVTSRLLVEIIPANDKVSILNTAKRDGNYKQVDNVIDDNEIIRPLQVDSQNDYLFVDLIVE